MGEILGLPTPQEPEGSNYCKDCEKAVEPCGWGELYCNNPDTPNGQENLDWAREAMKNQGIEPLDTESNAD